MKFEHFSHQFEEVKLGFDSITYNNVFSNYNSKTLSETLTKKRYIKYTKNINGWQDKYSKYLSCALGEFLLLLKNSDDKFYLNFLNPNGDLIYSDFRISEAHFYNYRGIYAYILNDSLKYIGRCRDSMKERINDGYGHISPVNTLKHGQSSNCRLNAKITKYKKQIKLYLHLLNSPEEIKILEKKMICSLAPPWNIQHNNY